MNEARVTQSQIAEQEEVLAFWRALGPDKWFARDAELDAAIRRRYRSTHRRAIADDLSEWEQTAEGALALILVLDQFPRNMFRGTPRAFAADARALALARDAVGRGFDEVLLPVQRWFVYLPFEHAEDLAMQRESLRLFERLATDAAGAGTLTYAMRHYAVIERFGRFPHRNAILGRASTPAELAFLAQPGSSF